MPHTNTDILFTTPFGTFELQRLPPVAGLKAWDGADACLLELAAEQVATSALVINDNFGALACALHRLQPVSWSDSFTTHAATRENYKRNQLADACEALPATSQPQRAFDLVLWRVPKSTGLFEQQIARIFSLLQPGTVIFAGGMDKHLLPETKTLLSRLGEVTTLPGKRKAHVFAVHAKTELPSPRAPKTVEIAFPEHDLMLSGDANVFARDKIDIGARFFIENFSKLPLSGNARVADLGCGNGILSLALAHMHPAVDIHLFDESYQAVASARANWERNIGPADAQRFHVGDGLDAYEGTPFDLILCNPPFHQQHVIGDHVARQLFAQARRHLRRGGELWIVGNRHLDYPVALKRLFGQCRQVAANAKFVVLAAKA